MSYPTRPTPSIFLSLDKSKKRLARQIEKYGDEHCVLLLEMMDKLMVDLHFAADCQEFVDALNNARSYSASAKDLEGS